MGDRVPVSDSPVDHIRKQLPRGNGDWPGFDVGVLRLKCAAHKMADEPYMPDEHVRLMAIMGCGLKLKAEMPAYGAWLHKPVKYKQRG